MRANFMKKWVWLTLLTIIFFAVLIRLLPLTQYAVWGSDTGEYYYLTETLIEDGKMAEEYDGWGFGYPYFPGMFYITGAVSLLAGTDLFLTMLILTPVLSTISVAFIFLITRRIGGSAQAALIAAAVIAVAMPHVLTTSHAMPGALGDMLVLMCIIMLLKTYEKWKFFWVFLIASFALVITHHLSTFFLIISVIGISLVREFFRLPDTDPVRVKIERAFLLFLIILTVFYWVFYARPFSEGVVERGLGGLDSAYIFILAFLGWYGYYMISFLLRKYSKYRYRPKEYSARRQGMLFLAFAVSVTVVVALGVTVRIPPLETVPEPSLVLYLAPLAVLMVFGVLGPSDSERRREGTFIIAWLAAIAVSFVISMVTGNREIIVFRFFQYMAAPFAILIGLGCVAAYRILRQDLDLDDAGSSITKPSMAGYGYTIIIVAVIIAAGLTAYPPSESLSGFQEGIHDWEMDSVYWCRGQLEPDATVATDHRLSSMLFGFAGLNASWDNIHDTFHEERFADVRSELEGTTLPSGKKRVDYVVISDSFKSGVALVHYEEAEAISEAAEAKFELSPFYKVYDSGKVQVYAIDWSYA